MATIGQLKLTRAQLATFLKDHEAIKQFEKLFSVVDSIAPDVINEVSIAAENAGSRASEAVALVLSLAADEGIDSAVNSAKLNQALGDISRIADALERLAVAPRDEPIRLPDDVSPPQRPVDLIDSDATVNGSLILSKESGKGIKIDKVTPTFGWKDLIGDVVPKTIGVGAPVLGTFRNDVRWFSYTTGDDGDIIYHIPHDYAPGTDLFMHVHWGHNGTNISGSIDIRFHLTYAKGHDQANFPADVEPHLVVGSLSIANTPQYRHKLNEIQISTNGGSATQLDTSVIEPDGIIIVHYDLDVVPTITGGTTRPFIFAIDLHYQATNITTKQKAPNFYV